MRMGVTKIHVDDQDKDRDIRTRVLGIQDQRRAGLNRWPTFG